MPNYPEAVEILLVEDSATDAELCIDALRSRNLANNLTWKKDGAAAIDYLFSSAEISESGNPPLPKLILLDLGLPKVTGLEVLEKIKSNDATRKIPVVIMTSSKESRDISAAYDLGVNSYVTKPVEFDAFSAIVKQLGLYWLLLNQPPQ